MTPSFSLVYFVDVATKRDVDRLYKLFEMSDTDLERLPGLNAVAQPGPVQQPVLVAILVSLSNSGPLPQEQNADLERE